MLTLTPHPGQMPGVTSVSINGYWVSAKIDGEPTDLRTPNLKWLDPAHMAVVDALRGLEQALAALVRDR